MIRLLYRIQLLCLLFLFLKCKNDEPKQQAIFSEPVSENVTFLNPKDSIQLYGSISLPDREGTYPAVILISGNGEHDRDAKFGSHKPFLDVSNHFVKQGIAVLRYDKRGVGESEGDYSSATSFDFAEDVRAAVAYLLTKDQIQKQNIGLIGHSEGGLIAPIVAANNSDIAFIISLAGSSIPGDQILLSQQKAIATAKGITPKKINESQKLNNDAFKIVKQYTQSDTLNKHMVAYIKSISENDQDKPEGMTFDEYVNLQVNAVLRPWMVNFLRFKPETYIQQVKCPVLALNGDRDLQVLAKDNLPEWKRILEASGNNEITIKELSGLNHLFQSCKTGLPGEYEEIDESFSFTAMEEMTNWIEQKLR